MSRMQKSLRLLKLLEILSAKRHYVTAVSLAEQLGVSERTIYRDLYDLITLGFPLYNDRGYKLINKPKSHSWTITPNEVRTLHLFLNASPLSKHETYKQQIDPLILKLKTMAQPAYETDDIPIESADVSPALHRHVEISQLEKALTEHCCCRVFYQSLEDEQPRWRTLQPYAMAIREGKWYLIAKDENSEEMRLYRVERIQNFQLTNTTFVREESFSVESYFQDSWSVFHGEKQTVKLRLQGMAIRVVQERRWLTPQLWQPVSDDEVICSLNVQGIEEIMGWALSMGPNVEILDPPHLRQQIQLTLSKTLQQYNEAYPLPQSGCVPS